MTTRLICQFHAESVIPPERHLAYVAYQDSAGVQLLCKESLDARLDAADDDPDLEPKGFWFL